MIWWCLLWAATNPLALRVEVESLGRGTTGTVVAVAVQVAPEDRPFLGERVRFQVTFWRANQKLDDGSGVAELAADGSFLVYREWPPGEGAVQVEVRSLDGTRVGAVERKVVVPVLEKPFLLPEGVPPDAAVLAPSPPWEEGVRFSPPRLGTVVGTVELTLHAPANTGEVRFFQDEELVLVKNRPPWQLSLSLGAHPHRTSVRAEAWSAEGRFLGEDVVVLSGSESRLDVQILLREAKGEDQPVRITVAVSPPGLEEEVLLYLDERPVARWLSCPCVTELAPQALRSARVLVAEARGGGRQGEAVLVAGTGTLVETARVEVVELPVAVLDATGKPVPDLSPADFQVWEDGRPVVVEKVARSVDLPVSLGLAVDTSGSMEKDFPLVRQAVDGFLNDFLRPGDRFFLGSFAWEFALLLPWGSEPRFVGDRLSGVRVEGGTSLHDAVIKALELFRGRKSPRALVVITDGEDTTSRTGWEAALRYARTMRTPIFPVGIRVSVLDFVLRSKLSELAAATGGEAFFVGNAQELPAVYRRIGEQLRHQYVVVYRSPATTAGDAFRPVTVKVQKQNVRVRTIPGYFPAP